MGWWVLLKAVRYRLLGGELVAIVREKVLRWSLFAHAGKLMSQCVIQLTVKRINLSELH